MKKKDIIDNLQKSLTEQLEEAEKPLAPLVGKHLKATLDQFIGAKEDHEEIEVTSKNYVVEKFGEILDTMVGYSKINVNGAPKLLTRRAANLAVGILQNMDFSAAQKVENEAGAGAAAAAAAAAPAAKPGR